MQGWFDRTPDDFRFAWKASKFITHWKQLSERCDSSLALMESRLALLRHKARADPVPAAAEDARQPRSGSPRFLKMLNPARRYTFEFRHPSWYEAPIFDLLRQHDAALCLSDHAAAPAPWEVTASFVYIRGHGPSGRYHGNYTDADAARLGRRRFAVGEAKAARCGASSTTTSRARRRTTRKGCSTSRLP